MKQEGKRMRAVGVFPQQRRVEIVDHPEPAITRPGEVKMRMLEVGVCGTDKDITSFLFGTPPSGFDYLVLGHESLAEVVETAPDVGRVSKGDLVVGMVRTPCASPHCRACRSGRQDFCFTGKYHERGIKDLHGFMTEFVIEAEQWLHPVPRALREVAVLVEPLTIAEKALIEARGIQQRLPWWGERHTALVLGAGPVGLLGAMLLASNGFDVSVYSRGRAPSAKSRIVEAIGGKYFAAETHSVEQVAAAIGNIDLVYEAAGAPQLAFEVLEHLGANGLFVFTGVPKPQPPVRFDTDTIMRHLVMRNHVVMGTVNAGWDAFEAAVRDLASFHTRWPQAVRALITGRFPLKDFHDPVTGHAGGIKNVIVIGE